jgi:GNAT superfamily N-acetyltransferase
MAAEKDLEDAADMNEFLRRYALDQSKKGTSRTFILRDERSETPNRVIAYYTTSVGQLLPTDLPKVVSPRMAIPVAVLQRLAVDKSYHRQGIGTKMLIHYLVRLVRVSHEIGVYALVLEPMNDRVRAFYERFGLQPLPDDRSRLFAKLTDVRGWLVAHGHGKLVDP